MHVALSSGPSPRGVNYSHRVKSIAKGYKFYMGLYSEIFEIFLLLNRTMANNFSPFYGSYVLNQFPGIVMFSVRGFYVSASGAIQGHHGPLVRGSYKISSVSRFIRGFTGVVECSGM